MRGRSLAALFFASLPLVGEAETLLVANIGVLVVGYGVDGLAYSGL